MVKQVIEVEVDVEAEEDEVEGERWRVDKWSRRCYHAQIVEESQLTWTMWGDWWGLVVSPTDRKGEMIPLGEERREREREGIYRGCGEAERMNWRSEMEKGRI
jgi:hypothetical protein